MLAPVAVIVVDVPAHIVGDNAVRVSDGIGDTFIVTVLLFVQPFTSVAFTV